MTEESIPHAKEFIGDASTQVLINQILLALVLRDAGAIALSISEIDRTGGYMLNMQIDPEGRWIKLTTEQKQ